MIAWGNLGRACKFSLGCISERVSDNSQPSLAVLEVRGKDELELCQSSGLKPAPESALLRGAWISCTPPGRRGDMSRRQRKSLSVPGGQGRTQYSKPVQIKGS